MENYSCAAKCKKSDCLKSHHLTLPRQYLDEENGFCSLPPEWKEKLEFKCDCRTVTFLNYEIWMINLANRYYFVLELKNFVF